MRKILLRTAVLALAAAVLGWLLYPTVADQLAQKAYLEKEEAYIHTVRGMTPEAVAERLEAAETANRETDGDIRPGDVFTAPAKRSSVKYRELLDFGDGMIGQLEIPSIHVSLPITHSSADIRPDRELVHVEGSSLPGETGNTHTVLAGPGKQKAPGILGDLALTGDRMLEDLDRVTPGDRMMILLADRTLLYEVRGVQTLSPEGLKEWTAERDPAEDRLTLVTERDGRRLLVEAVRIPVSSATEGLQAGDTAKLPADWVTILALGSPMMLLVLAVMTVTERIKRRTYRLPGERKAREIAAEPGEENGNEDSKRGNPNEEDLETAVLPGTADHAVPGRKHGLFGRKRSADRENRKGQQPVPAQGDQGGAVPDQRGNE